MISLLVTTGVLFNCAALLAMVPLLVGMLLLVWELPIFLSY
jgi:hypothetical protein